MSAELVVVEPRSVTPAVAPHGSLRLLLALADADDDDDAAIAGALRVLLVAGGGALAADEPLDLASIDRRLVAIDRGIAGVLDAILHHPALQALEARWRGLRFVVDRVDAGENIVVEILDASKEDLRLDFEESPELAHSGLHAHVYTRALATYGGHPYGLLCADFDVTPAADDLALLRACAAVAALAHVPFVANAGVEFFGVRSLAELPGLGDLGAHFEGPHFAAWQRLRREPFARYLGLCAPRFLLRAPYNVECAPATPLRYREGLGDGDAALVWGHASLAFAVRVAAAFARFRWCVEILGSRACPGITTPDAGLSAPIDGPWIPCPIEALVSRRLQEDLTEAGLIALTYDRRAATLSFDVAPSLFRDEGPCPISGQLPYVFLAGRIAHYLKRIQRDTIGTWEDTRALHHLLDAWLRRYVADVDDPHWETRVRRPFRRAALTLDPHPRKEGWVACHLDLEPHLTHNGAPIVLAIVGRLDRGPA
ncbi:MAG: type VI secretion system contractile sheath large subunit [Nannocystaceae bacterium]